ncbi:MAG: hypothetical protein JOY58_11355 [Solirubrobacterales bacterium]|nr:hypothetical protein [Solirubrobacterales bacterium]
MDGDDLYGLSLDRFIPERNALARSLRKQGRRDEAAQVAALRKPSVAAWAVNQLVRTQREPVAELFAAGDALREAHQQVVSGHGGGGSLAAAVRREREAVEALVGAAQGLLDSDGHELTAATIERLSDTLHAGALDLDAREMVRAARLQHELRHVGLGDGLEASAPPIPSRSTRQAPAGDKRAQQAERERARARRAAEARARRNADRAARALQSAQERRDRAAQALRDAEAELAQARAQAHEAARELG